MSTTELNDSEKKYYPFLDPSDANYDETVQEFKLAFPETEWKIDDNGVFMIIYSTELAAALSSQTEEHAAAEVAPDAAPMVKSEDNSESIDSYWDKLFESQESQATKAVTEPSQPIIFPLASDDFSWLATPTTLDNTCAESDGTGGLFSDNESCGLSIGAYNYLIDFMTGQYLLYPETRAGEPTPLKAENACDDDQLAWFYDGFLISRLITIDTWIDANVTKAMAHTGMSEHQRDAAVKMIKDIRSWEGFMIPVLDIVRSVPVEARDENLVNTGRDILMLYMLIQLQGSLPEYMPVDAVANVDRGVSVNDEKGPIFPVPVATQPTVRQDSQRFLVTDRAVRKGAHSTSYTYVCPFRSCGHQKIAFPTVKEHLIRNHLNASLKVFLPDQRSRAKVLRRMWRAAELVVDNEGGFIDHRAGLLEVLLRRGTHLGLGICREHNVNQVHDIVKTWQREDVREVKDVKNRVVCRKLMIRKESEPDYDVFVRNLVDLGLVRKQKRKSRFSDPENRSPVGYDEFEHNRNMNVKPGSSVRSVGDNEIEGDEVEAGTIRAAKRQKITPETASDLHASHNSNVSLDPLASFDSNNINSTFQGNDDDAAMFDIPSSAPSASSLAQFDDLLYNELRQLHVGYTN